ncbi:MAG: hypothetical protein RIA71_08495 [Oceanicaulis sp.]
MDAAVGLNPAWMAKQMTEHQSELIYRPTCGLIMVHHVFDAPQKRDRARSINAVLGAAIVMLGLGAYLRRDALLDAFTLPQALAVIVLSWLTAAWLVEISIMVLCRPKRLFLRWPRPQRASKTLDETWGRSDRE